MQKQANETEFRINTLTSELQRAAKNLEESKEQYSKESKFLVDRMNLEREQEIVKLEKAYNDRINKLNEEHQKRVEELLDRLDSQAKAKTAATQRKSPQ